MTNKQRALEAFDIYQTMSFPDLDNRLKTFAALVAPHTETIRAALTAPEVVTVEQISNHIQLWKFSDEHDYSFGMYIKKTFPNGLIVKGDE